jgi:hypothetical protein
VRPSAFATALLGTLLASQVVAQDNEAAGSAAGAAGTEATEELREDVAKLSENVAEVSASVRTLSDQLAELRTTSEQGGLDMLQHFGVGLALASDRGDAKRVGAASVDPGGFVRIDTDRNVRAGVILEFHSLMFCEKLDWDDPDYLTVVRPSVSSGGVQAGSQPPPSGAAATTSAASDQSAQLVYRQHATESGYRASEREADVPKKKGHLKQVPPCNRSRRAHGFFVAVQPGSDELIDAIGAGWMWRWPDKMRLVGDRVLNFGIGLLSDPNVDVLGDGFVENELAPLNADGTRQQVRLRKTDRSGFFITASVEVGR